MAGDTHLFLALSATAFGEVTLGLRLASELVGAGDQAIFLAPQSTAALFKDTRVRHLPVDGALWRGVEAAVRGLLHEHRCRSLALVDTTAVLLGLQEVGESGRFLTRLDLPVVALDCWNLPEAGLRWDHGPDAMAIPEIALDLTRRLLPVPVCRPTAGPGAYRALPPTPRVGDDEIAAERAGLGLGPRDKLVLMAASRFWEPEVQLWQHHRRAARLVPRLVTEALGRLTPEVRLVHVGPSAWEPGALGERYLWIGQVPPDRFARLVAAADVLLSLNTAGTTNIAAVARGTPVVLAINSHHGGSAEEVLAYMGRPSDDPLRPWLDEACPLFRFRLFPLGLFELLSPVLAGNPYTETLRTVEILDGRALSAAVAELLFDEEARAGLRARQESYCREVRALPTGSEVYRSYL